MLGRKFLSFAEKRENSSCHPVGNMGNMGRPAERQRENWLDSHLTSRSLTPGRWLEGWNSFGVKARQISCQVLRCCCFSEMVALLGYSRVIRTGMHAYAHTHTDANNNNNYYYTLKSNCSFSIILFILTGICRAAGCTFDVIVLSNLHQQQMYSSSSLLYCINISVTLLSVYTHYLPCVYGLRQMASWWCAHPWVSWDNY